MQVNLKEGYKFLLDDELKDNKHKLKEKNANHFHGAIFGVEEQLVAPQESRGGVVPLGEKGVAFVLTR